MTINMEFHNSSDAFERMKELVSWTAVGLGPAGEQVIFKKTYLQPIEALNNIPDKYVIEDKPTSITLSLTYNNMIGSKDKRQVLLIWKLTDRNSGDYMADLMIWSHAFNDLIECCREALKNRPYFSKIIESISLNYLLNYIIQPLRQKRLHPHSYTEYDVQNHMVSKIRSLMDEYQKQLLKQQAEKLMKERHEQSDVRLIGKY